MKTKTLYFEGAGMDFYEHQDKTFSDVGNHRIRTAFLNDKGEKIYLELNHSRVEKKDKRSFHQGYPEGALIAWVDFCFYIDKTYPKVGPLSGQHVSLPCNRKVHFPYTLQGILEFVNKEIGCSFDKVEVLDTFEWYHVHGNNGTYNLMDDHTPNPARTEARKHVDRYMAEMTKILFPNRKYGGAYSVKHIEGDLITFRYCVSDKELKESGLHTREFTFDTSIYQGWKEWDVYATQ